MTATTSPDTVSADIPMSAHLKSATQRQHTAAERGAFMGQLMTGKLPTAAYVGYTRQLREIYAALEDTAAQLQDHDPVAALTPPVLSRVDALDADLSVLAGPDWRATLPVTAPTLNYTAAIRRSRNAPARFVGHHYTRLLGDLSGGQIVARMIVKHYGGDVAAATRFYDFSGIDDLAAFKAEYRQTIDNQPWTTSEAAAMCDSANSAFQFTRELCDDLLETA